MEEIQKIIRYVKLKDGTDLLGEEKYRNYSGVLLKNIAKVTDSTTLSNWVSLGNSKEIFIKTADTYFIDIASDDATSKYKEFTGDEGEVTPPEYLYDIPNHNIDILIGNDKQTDFGLYGKSGDKYTINFFISNYLSGLNMKSTDYKLTVNHSSGVDGFKEITDAQEDSAKIFEFSISNDAVNGEYITFTFIIDHEEKLYKREFNLMVINNLSEIVCHVPSSQDIITINALNGVPVYLPSPDNLYQMTPTPIITVTLPENSDEYLTKTPTYIMGMFTENKTFTVKFSNGCGEVSQVYSVFVHNTQELFGKYDICLFGGVHEATSKGPFLKSNGVGVVTVQLANPHNLDDVVNKSEYSIDIENTSNMLNPNIVTSGDNYVVYEIYPKADLSDGSIISVPVSITYNGGTVTKEISFVVRNDNTNCLPVVASDEITISGVNGKRVILPLPNLLQSTPDLTITLPTIEGQYITENGELQYEVRLYTNNIEFEVGISNGCSTINQKYKGILVPE